VSANIPWKTCLCKANSCTQVMKLGVVNTFAQGMKLEKERWSLGVTGRTERVRLVTRGSGSTEGATRL
jgi:hypothetical protein